MPQKIVQPEHIRVEASSVCQLKCPVCPTALGEIKKSIVGSGLLKKEHFLKLIEENPWIKRIELSNWGEIFLNKELPEILKVAFENNVKVHASNGVNLNHASPEVLESLVRYQVEHLTCSIDGASQKTYEIYRIGGNFEKVISHIKQINHYKKIYKSVYPRLTWQFVVFGHNENELAEAKKMAIELDMEFRGKLSWDENFSPVKNVDLVKSEIDLSYVSRSEYRRSTKKNYVRKICLQLWNQPQINYDGTVLGCCVNHWGSFGNAFEEGLFEVLNNERIAYAREMLTGKVAPRPDIPCFECQKFKDMQEFNCFITDEEIEDNQS